MDAVEITEKDDLTFILYETEIDRYARDVGATEANLYARLEYRLYAIDDQKAYLLENEELKKRDVSCKHLEAFLYSKDGYFVA